MTRSLPSRRFVGVVLILLCACSRPVGAAAPIEQSRAHGFVPVLIDVEFTPTSARPGDELSYTMHFENRGDAAASDEFSSFLHFEIPGTSPCTAIEFQDDRKPGTSTRAWSPGSRITVGPRILKVPSDAHEGVYCAHGGLYDRAHARSYAACDVGRFQVARAAKPSIEWQPDPLSEAEVAARRARLAARLVEPIMLEGDGWSFALDASCGAFAIEDHRTAALWASNPDSARFGVVSLSNGDRRVEVELARFDRIAHHGNEIEAEFEPAIDGIPCGATVHLRIAVESDGRALGVRASTDVRGAWKVDSFAALDHAFFVTDEQHGYAVLPRQLGYLLPADHGLPHERRYSTYDDTSMSMIGVVQRESALLVSWDDLGTNLRTHVTCEDSPFVAGRRTESLSLDLDDGVGAFEIRPLGRGRYVEIAAAYREIAERKGLVQTLAAKRARNPQVAKLAGAPIFRAEGLVRSRPHSLYNSSDQESVIVRHRFDEIERLAEHWHDTLGLDRATVIVTGWNRRGYDNQLPDTLPANDECGGDQGLAHLSQRLKQFGFTFGLHDNLQDMYPDAPSWDPSMIELDEHGELRSAGIWEGGRCYRMCSNLQAVFAQRNWPEMERRYQPDQIYADTILSVKLGECTSPDHPLTRALDVANKRKLCELARANFASVGAEGGKEWGVPLLDTFEGLMSYKTYEGSNRTVVPLFQMVFGDCVHVYTMQEDRLDVADAKRVLDHAVCAQMPEFAFEDHVYFDGAAARELAVEPEVLSFEQVGPSRLRLRWRWKANQDVHEPLDFFVHFKHPLSPRVDGISFEDAFPCEPSSDGWKRGDVIDTGPRDVFVTEDLEGEYEVLVGFTRDGVRRDLTGIVSESGRHRVGTLLKTADGWQFAPGRAPDASRVFARGDGGWGAKLCATDRLIKNVFELLSPLARLSEDQRMTDHRFLRRDQSVEQTWFGDTRVVVNYGTQPYRIDTTVLGPFGVLIENPRFIAFHALEREGVKYPGGALFTLTSLDGKPLYESTKIRVYHGFGGTEVPVGGRWVSVEREEVFGVQ